MDIRRYYGRMSANVKNTLKSAILPLRQEGKMATFSPDPKETG